jgi:SanA protein
MAIVSNVTEKPHRFGHPGLMHITRRQLAFILFLDLIAVGIGFPVGWRAWVSMRYASLIHPLDEAPSARVALVLGARVYANGRLSTMLRDRVDTAVALYQAGKVDRLIMSGAGDAEYNEPAAMTARALALGVPAESIQLDYGGLRTYDSCYRAKEIFQVEDAVIVTQQFHLPRALFLCESLGIQASGVIADQRVYNPRSIAWSEMREAPATFLALIDIVQRHPPPMLGDPIPLE